MTPQTPTDGKLVKIDKKGRFLKNVSSWNKGKKGFRHSGSFQKGHKINFGRHWKMSEKGKKNISKVHIGKHFSLKTEFKKGQIAWNKGKKCFWAKPPIYFGEKSSNWRGGISFEPYSVDWNESLRRTIRERDRYACQLCGKLQGDLAHDIHHIDYNKLNCNPNNLITLCHSCNAKVNGNRNYWTNYFKQKCQKK
jgi:hypothetical protein